MADTDDGSIEDHWSLLRRISPDQIVPDKNTGGLRVSSAAFKDPSMSVDVEELLEKLKLDYKFTLSDHPQHSLVKFSAGVAREHQQAVVPTPLPENPAHAEVRGSKSGSVSRSLSRAAVWVHRV